MAYQPLTKEQFQSARQAGFTSEKIIQMEQKRKLDSGITPRTERIEQGLPVGRGERATPTGGGNLLRGIVAPFAKVATSVKNIGQAVQGKEMTDMKSKYLGNVERVGKGFDVTKGLTPENVGAVKDAVGTGAELASYLPVGTAIKAGVGIARQPFKQAVKESAKLIGREGAVQGGLGAGGRSLQEGDSAKEFAGKTLGGIALGGITGLGLGAGGSALARAVLKAPVQELKRRATEATSKALGISGKRTPSLALVQPEQSARGLATIKKYATGFDHKASDNLFDDSLKGLVEAKSNVFNQYNKIASQAGKEGVNIDVMPLEQYLTKYIKEVTTTPKKARAERLISELRSNFPTGKASPVDMQDYIKLLNEELGGVSGGAEKGAVGVVSDFTKQARQALDDGIGKLGKEYQVFKDEYSALKSIEDSLVRQYQKAMRRKGSGLAEYADLAGNAELVNSLITMNPGLMAKGLATRLGSKFIKNLNDPERWLREAFDNIEKAGVDSFTPSYKSSNIPRINQATSIAKSTAIKTPKNPISETIPQVPKGTQPMREVMERLNRGGYTKDQVIKIMGELFKNNPSGKFSVREIADTASKYKNKTTPKPLLSNLK